MEDSLFPVLPESLSELSDQELENLNDEHQIALDKIDAEDEEYVGGLDGPDVIAALELGLEQIERINAEKALRVEAATAYATRKAELVGLARKTEELSETEVVAEADGEGEGDDDGDAEEAAEEAVEEAAVEAEVEEAVTAAATQIYRRAPMPAATLERTPTKQDEQRTVLVAAAGVDGVTPGVELDRIGLANAMVEHVKRKSRPSKHAAGIEEKTLVASAHFPFPPERTLRPNDIEGNNAKIRGIGNPFLGVEGMQALVASGGLCAPLTPFYDIPDFAVTDRPVRDALPSFQAERGGISVPSVSTIGSITTGVGVIEEAEDAAGGTYATKSCQDLTCPTWTDVAVGAIYHCREYGNFNARAWPEGIAHENNLTMAALSRTADARLLDRIKALSINVTQAAIGAQLNMYASLVYAITRMEAGVRYRLRLERGVRYRVIMPEWVSDALAADSSATQFTRYDAQAEMAAHLANIGVSIAWSKDTVSTGTSQGFNDESASAIDDFPDDVQFPFFVEGEFLHLDSGVLELGIVRDSTLNSTNDYQVFGEVFENVARIGPTQGALWATVDVCPSGGMPSLVSGLTC